MKKILLFKIFFSFTISLLLATGSNSGTSCSNSYSYTMGQEVDLGFANNQQEYFIEFTANDTSLVAQILENGFTPFAKISEIHWYQMTSCSGLTLIESAYAEQSAFINHDANHISANVNQGSQYLIVLKRDPAQGLPSALFRFRNKTLIKTSCPVSFDLPSGEMIHNGDYTYTSVDLPHIWGAHTQQEVCNWEGEAGTPDLIYIGPKTNNPQTNDASGSLISDPYTYLAAGYFNAQKTIIYSEAISTGFDFPMVAGDQIYLSMYSANLVGTGLSNRPDKIKFVLAHSTDIDNIASPKYANTDDILNSGQLIGEIEAADMDDYATTQSFKKFTFCETANDNYDRLYIYTWMVPQRINYSSGGISLDKVSLINMRQISEIPDVEINLCEGLTGHLLNGVQAGNADFDYQWTPSTALSNSQAFNPFTTSTNFASSYTMDMTHPLTACTTSATINVTLADEPFDAGDNLTISDPCQNATIGPDCIIPGATYSWSPATGLSDPNAPNPIVYPSDNGSRTYTLTVTYPGITPPPPDQVVVTYQNTQNIISIPHGEDIAYLKSNQPYNNFTFSNSHFTSSTSSHIVNRTFFIQGEFIIDEEFSFVDCNFYMAENAKITIDNVRAEFLDDDDSHPNPNEFIKACDPDQFWDGIYATGNASGNLYMAQQMSISNSKNGVVVEDGAAANIGLIDFNRNNRCLQVKPSNSGHEVRTGDNRYRCDSPLKDENGNEYYPQYAIEVNDWHSITASVILQGDPHRSAVIEATAGGIYCKNSSTVAIYDHVFSRFQNQYIVAFPQPPVVIPVSTTAVTLISDANASADYRVKGNTYFECLNGIISSGDQRIEVENESFNSNSVNGASFLRIADNDGPIEVLNNTIDNAQTGIYLSNVSEVEVKSNTLDMEVQATSTAYTSKYNNLSLGIYLNNFNHVTPSHAPSNWEPSIEISDNTIKHSSTGISCFFTKADLINNTILDMNDNLYQPLCLPWNPCPATPAYGIKVMGTRRGYNIRENKVENDLSQYSTNPVKLNVIGITMEYTAFDHLSSFSGQEVKCNRTVNVGQGLRFVGDNMATNKINNNVMENNYRGFVLANNGFVGDVGENGTYSAANRWIGTFNGSHTFAETSNGSLTTFYVDNTPTYFPTIASFHATPSFLPMSSNISSSHIPIAPLNCTVRRLKSGNKQSSTATGQNKAWRKHLLKGKLPYLLHAADSAQRLNRQLLYWQLAKDSVLRTDTAWKSYADSMKNTPLGRQLNHKAPKASRKGMDHFDAKLNQMSHLMDKFNSQKKFSKKDTADLKEIAGLCPYYDGIAVYQARMLMLEMRMGSIVNACEVSKVANNQLVKRSKKTKPDEFLLYPNPAKNLLTVEFEVTEGEVVNFELYDLLGKKVFAKALKQGLNHKLELSGMHTGIYFYRLSTAKERLRSGKLVIE